MYLQHPDRARQDPPPMDNLIDCTFISDKGKIFYNSGIRTRGDSSRTTDQGSYRIEFPAGKLVDGEYSDINL